MDPAFCIMALGGIL